MNYYKKHRESIRARGRRESKREKWQDRLVQNGVFGDFDNTWKDFDQSLVENLGNADKKQLNEFHGYFARILSDEELRQACDRASRATRGRWTVTIANLVINRQPVKGLRFERD